MNFPLKTTTSLQRKKQRRKDKILSAFPRNFIKKFGSKSLVFIDESGFEENQDCIYAWSKKGKKFMVSKRENEVKEKIQQPGEEKRKKI